MPYDSTLYTSESGFGVLISKIQHKSNSSLRTVTSQIPKPLSDVYIYDFMVNKPLFLNLQAKVC